MFAQDYYTHLNFMQDLTITERFNMSNIEKFKKAITKTYNAIHEYNCNNAEDYAGFVIALNWKIWERHDKDRDDIAEIYDDLWRKANDYGEKHFKGDDLTTFLHIID